MDSKENLKRIPPIILLTSPTNQIHGKGRSVALILQESSLCKSARIPIDLPP